MRRPIARIRINAGNPGWYDPLTNIHLTISRPEAMVFEGSNTTNIKKGVAHKLVCVVDGDLDVNTVSVETKEEIVKSVREVAQPIEQAQVIETKEPVKEEVKVEETIVEPVEEKIEEAVEATEEVTEEPVVEEVVEVAEEVVEEKPKKKTTRKKSTK